MEKQELASLVNKCLNLNHSERKINFYSFIDDGFSDVCLDDQKAVLKVKAIRIPGYEIPISSIWHASYSLKDENSQNEDNGFLRHCLEIPLEFLRSLGTNKKLPEFLDLFIHYKNENRLDIYVREE